MMVNVNFGLRSPYPRENVGELLKKDYQTRLADGVYREDAKLFYDKETHSED